MRNIFAATCDKSTDRSTAKINYFVRNHSLNHAIAIKFSDVCLEKK